VYSFIQNLVADLDFQKTRLKHLLAQHHKINLIKKGNPPARLTELMTSITTRCLYRRIILTKSNQILPNSHYQDYWSNKLHFITQSLTQIGWLMHFRFVPVSVALSNIAPSRFAPERFALDKSALPKYVSLKSAPDRSALVRSAK